MSAPPRAVPASLQTATTADTPYGGVDQTWSEVAALWVILIVGTLAQAFDGAVSAPADTDSASAVGREHPAAAPGLRLVVDGDPDAWRVRRVDRGVPSIGRMTLRLDRLI